MIIFITGATGYLGTKLVEKILSKNFTAVYLLVRNESRIPESWKKTDVIKFICGDITDFVIPDGIKIDVAVHLASYNKPDNENYLKKINVQGTKRVCDIVKKNNINKLIALSSVSVLNGIKAKSNSFVYKNNFDYSAKDEYGKSKIEAEKILLSYTDINKIIIRSAYICDADNYFEIIKNRMRNLKFKFVAGAKNYYWHTANPDLVSDLITGLIFGKIDFEKEGKNIVKIAGDENPATVYELYSRLALEAGVKKPVFVNPAILKFLIFWNELLVRFLPAEYRKKVNLKNNLIAFHNSNEKYEVDSEWIKKYIT
ncbi:MAG TPA: NAD(P)-dependent oxidoreductase [bacterium]|nr:NAD(P)-dependent oxidoreductase [bacterium]HPN31093.1 NAD(P)-dependent oxidoreductase [bacterium]